MKVNGIEYPTHIIFHNYAGHGVKFDIVGESNYLPGRTFQVRFRKMKSKEK